MADKEKSKLKDQAILILRDAKTGRTERVVDVRKSVVQVSAQAQPLLGKE